MANPRTWHDRVRFDEIVCSNYWDLAPNFDDLNERYEAYRRQPWQRQADEQRRREQGEREAQ